MSKSLKGVLLNEFSASVISNVNRASYSPFDECRDHFVNTLRPRQNGHHFPDDSFKCTFLNEIAWILVRNSLSVPKGPINKIPSFVQIMAWRRLGDKPLSEPMMIKLLTHICVTRPQWVNVKIHFKFHTNHSRTNQPSSFHHYSLIIVGPLRSYFYALDTNVIASHVPLYWHILNKPTLILGHG